MRIAFPRIFHLGLILLAVGGLPSARAETPASTTPSTLTAFRDEGELQRYLNEIVSAAEKKRLAEEAAWKAKLKANPSLSTGTIAGITTPGATVVIENAATGFRREITAGADGTYRVGGLPVGQYKVTSGGIVRDVSVSIGGTAVGSSSNLDAVSVVGGGAIALLSPGTTAGDPVAAGDSITNVQTAGVDEGGIVKKSGDFLVVLRRGRLFSIRAKAKSLQAVSTANAYGPDISPYGSWYDEMLISGNTIVVIGYSYHRDGTEIGLFDFSDDGKISYRATYHLYSNDYYSSRNYASRLVGKTLIFYSPIDLFRWRSNVPNFPGVRRWNRATPKAPFERIVPATHIYRSGLGEGSMDQALHTVTRCDLSGATMDCRSTSVLGPSGSAFYVSGEAVYVWMVSDADESFGDSNKDLNENASVLRMPLDESPPSALRVQGSPIDQLSFLEKDGYLNVLVGAEAKGLRMWSAEGKSGSLALLRVPVSAFGNATASATPEDFRALPSSTYDDEDGFWYLHNRYVGNWLLFGSEEAGSAAFALRIDLEDEPTRLQLAHPVERIEAMGKDAVLVGGLNGDLRLTSVALGDDARPVDQFVLPRAMQGESRTHGFFYRPLADGNGMFGLPVIDETTDAASVAFVHNEHLDLRDAGDLNASAKGSTSDDTDDCLASCYGWYGDSRPIFIGDRIYALLGYELVEGKLQGGRMRELRRVNFSPKSRRH